MNVMKETIDLTTLLGHTDFKEEIMGQMKQLVQEAEENGLVARRDGSGQLLYYSRQYHDGPTTVTIMLMPDGTVTRSTFVFTSYPSGTSVAAALPLPEEDHTDEIDDDFARRVYGE